MIKIGQFNYLKIAQKTARGTFLFAGEFGQLFLPAKLTPSHCEVGDKIQVFLYQDANDKVVATTQKPRVEIGGIACLKVVSVSKVGAFLDWGLPKDLFVPFGQQSKKMNPGEFHIVAVYEDNTGRICGSSKLNRFVKPESKGLKTGQPVSLIVGDKTDLGTKMIVNQSYWGILHESDRFREIRYGQQLKGFIKNVRQDKRLDITLKKPGFEQNETLANKILKHLAENNGHSTINDKAPPDLIYKTFGVSKKVYKAELGSLYKQRKITIDKSGIHLVE
ncbi:GntR family transcriptional regulator [Aliikangiella marina]|uniref:GntR family transcriptional regulator n=1 Tax=Aliikangiella marina TaxID=1712262 RepID=A0A545T6U9_9GAMM|nr:S1-like domain-containing RNA-binding protein [Aliikangiella marina]TQV72950.1 GntR family transcriptional regulator [Aliikangiella marina]